MCHNLMLAEKNYSQIEKENLATVYSAKKYHQYLKSIHFTVMMDHQPLLSISSGEKGIPTPVSSRIQM